MDCTCKITSRLFFLCTYRIYVINCMQKCKKCLSPGLGVRILVVKVCQEQGYAMQELLNLGVSGWTNLLYINVGCRGFF